MDSVLLIFAVLSVGAVVAATYVFTVAARNYVSDPTGNEGSDNYMSGERTFVERSGQDRRQTGNAILFPHTLVNGDVISLDRRLGERREVG